MKQLLIVFQLLFSANYLFGQQAPDDKLVSLRGNNGQTFSYTTTGTADGNAWGGADGIYTDDSRLGKAAVHAGLLHIGQTGIVTVTIISGRSGYQGSTRNGITTSNYGAWSGSFQFGVSQNNNIPVPVSSVPVNITNYRGKNGSVFTFYITGTNDGNVWGGADGIYTDDSKLSSAAVHAGLLNVGQSAELKVTVVAGQSGYRGSSQHGISSRDYGSWNGSYSFGQTVGQAVNNNLADAPVNVTAYRGQNGTLYTFRVIGTTDGSVWGGADGIYTDDSKLSTAAVHAGLVSPGREAVIRVRIMNGMPGYKGSYRNGITSKDYASWSGSFKFE